MRSQLTCMVSKEVALPKSFFYAYLLSCIEEMPPHAKPFDPEIMVMKCNHGCKLSTRRSGSHFRVAWRGSFKKIRGESSKMRGKRESRVLLVEFESSPNMVLRKVA
jgi:hypothetical protein